MNLHHWGLAVLHMHRLSNYRTTPVTAAEDSELDSEESPRVLLNHQNRDLVSPYLAPLQSDVAFFF